MARKYGKKAAAKVERTMHEFKAGTLRTGTGAKVTSREQAIAIGLAQARRAGYKVPVSPTASHATKKPEPCIDVVFRVFPEGDVIALFPGEQAGHGLINSYMRLGQHGGASPKLVRELRHATRKEYAPLLAELKSIGYCLRIR